MNPWNIALSAALLGVWGAAAQAQPKAYPEQPIKLVVGYSPGGSVDIVARQYGQKLSELLGQSVIVENKAGASGTLAANAVKNAAPNGYTWVGTATIAPNPTKVLGPATPLTVVVTNTLAALPPGKVTIAKLAQTATGTPATGTASFSFAGTGTGVPATMAVATQAGSGSQTIDNLAAGQSYTWTEGVLSGWKLASIQCTDQNGAPPKSTITTDVATRQLSVALVSAEELVCTFTNRQTDTSDGGPTDPNGPGTPQLKKVPTLDPSKLVLMMLAVAAMGMAGLRRAQRR